MISKIPITNSPNIKNIIRAFLFLGRKDGFKNLSKFFPNYKYIVFSKSAISLMFIYKLRTKYENRKKPLIYLPDYFCNESTRYLRKINANIKFYPFKSINNEFFNSRFEHDKISIFLFVNYFGQNNYPKENIINSLKKKDVWIIEDSTHTIFSKKYLKNKSDFILISPHKTYSIPNGAIMLHRNKFSDLIMQDDFLKIKNANFGDHLINIYKTSVWIIKRLLQNIGIGISHDSFSLNNYNYNYNYKNKAFKENISFLSHSLLSEYNTKYISKKREQNVENWNLIISNLFPFLKAKKFKNTPYTSVYKFKNNPQKYLFLKEFSNYGIPFSSWPDLPSEVINNSMQHKEALVTKNSYVFLPINEKVTRIKIFNSVEKALKKYTKKLKFKKITSENEKFKLNFLIFNKNIIFAKVTVYKNIYSNEDSIDIDFNDEFIKKIGLNFSAINLLGALIFLRLRKNNYPNKVKILIPRNKFTDFIFTKKNLVIKNTPSLKIPLIMDSETRSKYITRQLFVEKNLSRSNDIDKFKIKFKKESDKNKDFLIYIIFKDDYKYKFYLDTNKKENVEIIDIDIFPQSFEIFLNIINIISKDLLLKSFKCISLNSTMYALLLKNYSKKRLSEINNLIIFS